MYICLFFLTYIYKYIHITYIYICMEADLLFGQR